LIEQRARLRQESKADVTSRLIERLESYKRQCPKCAKHFYHTNIFVLPWVSRCPIHQCTITSICPICKQPWPDITEMAGRECPGCGRPRFNEIKTSIWSDIKDQNYQPIANIYELFEHDIDLFHLVTVDHFTSERAHKHTIGTNTQWCKPIPVLSPQYPSFQVRCYNLLSHKLLKEINIPTFPVHYKSWRLFFDKELEKTIEAIKQQSWTDEIEAFTYKTRKQSINSLFKILVYIVNWIHQHASKKHTIYISSYRYLPTHYFTGAPDPCPYCMALSLWFFNAVANIYGNQTTLKINNYPFCIENGLNYFHRASTPFVYTNNTYYKLEESFVSWFYRRGLLISFLAILRFSFDFITQINNYRKSDKDYFLIPNRDDIFSDQYCQTKLSNNRLYFYFENENPLSSYQPRPTPKIDNICRKFIAYLANHKIDRNIDIGAISSSRLKYVEFSLLIHNFRKYILNLYNG